MANAVSGQFRISEVPDPGASPRHVPPAASEHCRWRLPRHPARSGEAPHRQRRSRPPRMAAAAQPPGHSTRLARLRRCAPRQPLPHLPANSPTQPNPSAGMHAFESGYVTLFNKRHHRTGPLFQGRFGAVLVEFESHARVLSRYVHLNPVEAGLARTPGEYAWSSYRYYLDPHGAPTWLDWRTILGELSARESAARIAYRRFVEASLGTTQPNPLDDAIDGGLLGSSQFVERYQDACVADGCGGRVRCDPPTTARARAASEPCTSGGALAVSRAVARIAWSTRCSLWRFATQHSQRSVAEGCPPDGRERRI